MFFFNREAYHNIYPVKRDCRSHQLYWKWHLSHLASPVRAKLALPCRSSLKWVIQLGRQIKSRSIIASVPLRRSSLFYRTAEGVKQINSLGDTEESEYLHSLPWEAQLWELIAQNTDSEMRYVHTNRLSFGIPVCQCSSFPCAVKDALLTWLLIWRAPVELVSQTEQVRCSGARSVHIALSFYICQSSASSVSGR